MPCDGRFSRIGSGAASYQDGFFGVRKTAEATEIMINATPSDFTPGVENWFNALDVAMADAPQRLIIDQRVGNGGSFASIAHFMGYLEAGPRPAQFLMPWIDPSQQGAVYPRMAECGAGYPGTLAFLWCGGSRLDVPAEEHPQRGALDQAKVAVLNGRDVSGNDFLSDELKRRASPTRIFGPGPTYGAFGMVMSLSSWGVGIAGPGLQATDAAYDRGPGSNLEERLSGPGVAPDERILQRQSDLLRGVDTQLEAARAWLSE